MNKRKFLTALFIGALSYSAWAQTPLVLNAAPWKLAAKSNVAEGGDRVSTLGYAPDRGWLPATVPGTILTTLVKNKIYPEPLYGENNRPNIIPDDLCRKDWWYRTTFDVPQEYAGRKIWLNFDGINYAAEVWVNGHAVGKIKGAFIRGLFNISEFVTPGKPAGLAVLISPQPTPGETTPHTIRLGTGNNYCVTPADGPTFMCTIGWDWLLTIPDRDAGIWQKVFLSATGPVVIKEPLIATDLPLPRIDSADVMIEAKVENVTDKSVRGELVAKFDDVSVHQAVEIKPNSSQVVRFDPKQFPQLHVLNPKLWWPNGFGEPNLHVLHLAFKTGAEISDAQDITFGIRKITYTHPPSDNVAFTVNGVPVFAKGGNWGMDEALKRVPPERLDAQIRMHQLANYTMIRNWIGQSTSGDLYDLCDKYGLLVWDEFFQASGGSPMPKDNVTYMANVRDKIVRFRNHPCIALWCGRNEGNPPKEINDSIKALMTELEPARLYQPNSKDGRGVRSGGPYAWRTPQAYYEFPEEETFKTEIGSVSIPTIESIQGMMPQKDWESINDDWAQHDLTRGAQQRRPYIKNVNARYGKTMNLADFARKGQMMNYEAFRAMYEGRQAKLFKPATGVLTWMSHPAQPSFVWQIYHYDLEPNSALFAVRKACEPIHIQLNEKEGTLQVINNLPTPLTGAKAHIVIYNLDGSTPYQNEVAVTAAPSSAATLGPVQWPANLSAVHFIKIELHDAAGKLLSDNFYWRGKDQEDLTALNQLPPVTLDVKAVRRDAGDKCFLDVTVRNPGPTVVLMAHLQLHRAGDQGRVLPVFYSGNYLSLAPKEEKTITIEADKGALKGEAPLVLIDGWNIGGVNSGASSDVKLALNKNAQVDSWPKNGLVTDYGTPQSEYHMNCGGPDVGVFKNDDTYGRGSTKQIKESIDVSNPLAAPESIYQSCRYRKASYLFAMKPLPPGKTYTVRLHFAELDYNEPGKRRMDVPINGKPKLKDFDIFKAAGAMRKAVVQDITGIMPDDEGVIEVDPKPAAGGKDTPAICGIEIFVK